jgi:hypothetical protein
MTRNDVLQWLILRVGLSGFDQDLGRSTNIPQLCQCAKDSCFECNRDELLDALYTMPREYAALIKFLSVGEGYHPVSFERVRNTVDWTNYFLDGDFRIKVLPEGAVHYQKLAQEIDRMPASTVA